MEERNSRLVSSEKSISYQPSRWQINEFEFSSGDSSVCRGAILKMKGSTMVWVGSSAEPRLCEMALGMPRGERSDALSTQLLGGAAAAAEGAVSRLAMRLATALAHPVYVCSGITLDRLTLPLVECALKTQLKNTLEH